MSEDASAVVSEETYDAPIDVVWQAITEKDRMRKWFFEQMTDFVPEVGFATKFTVHYEGIDYPHVWKITEVIPQQRIVYDWRYEGFSGESTVTWELSGTPNGTKLTLTHDGMGSFPQDDPAFSREGCQAGWDYFLHESLKQFLAQ